MCMCMIGYTSSLGCFIQRMNRQGTCRPRDLPYKGPIVEEQTFTDRSAGDTKSWHQKGYSSSRRIHQLCIMDGAMLVRPRPMCPRPNPCKLLFRRRESCILELRTPRNMRWVYLNEMLNKFFLHSVHDKLRKTTLYTVQYDQQIGSTFSVYIIFSKSNLYVACSINITALPRYKITVLFEWW
jgi:hypothetical protein